MDSSLRPLRGLKLERQKVGWPTACGGVLTNKRLLRDYSCFVLPTGFHVKRGMTEGAWNDGGEFRARPAKTGSSICRLSGRQMSPSAPCEQKMDSRQQRSPSVHGTKAGMTKVVRKTALINLLGGELAGGIGCRYDS